MYLPLLGLSLAAFWLLLSGYWSNPLLLFLGMLSIALAILLSWRIRRQYRLYSNISLLKRLPAYISWLVYEMYKANIAVVKNIWFPGENPISPAVKRLPMMQKTRLGQTIFANSITLTPGTVSFNVSNGKVSVHAIVEEAIIELMDGEMNKRAARLETNDDEDSIP